MRNFEVEIRSKVDKLVSENEDEKEISFPEEDFKSGFAQDIIQEGELGEEHKNEIEWLRDTMCASIIAFKDKELDKYKNLQEEIEHYCELTESYNLYMSYESLLDEIREKPKNKIWID